MKRMTDKCPHGHVVPFYVEARNQGLHWNVERQAMEPCRDAAPKRFDVHIYQRPPMFTDHGADRGVKLAVRHALSERDARVVMRNWRAMGYHAIRRSAGRPVTGR